MIRFRWQNIGNAYWGFVDGKYVFGPTGARQYLVTRSRGRYHLSVFWAYRGNPTVKEVGDYATLTTAMLRAKWQESRRLFDHWRPWPQYLEEEIHSHDHELFERWSKTAPEDFATNLRFEADRLHLTAGQDSEARIAAKMVRAFANAWEGYNGKETI